MNQWTLDTLNKLSTSKKSLTKLLDKWKSLKNKTPRLFVLGYDNNGRETYESIGYDKEAFSSFRTKNIRVLEGELKDLDRTINSLFRNATIKLD